MMNLQAAMEGPGALLSATDVKLPTGLSDEWKNNITDGSEHLDDNYRGSLRKLGGCCGR
jgi:hypothetical protein